MMKIVRKMYLTCEECGKSNSDRIKERKMFDDKIMCESCYISHTKYPFDHIPPVGEIHYDNEGRLLCHICGRGFHKLTCHIEQFHKISQEQYKEKFGINRTFKLTSESCKNKLRSEKKLKNLTKMRTNIGDMNTSNKGTKRREQYFKNRVGSKYNKDKKETE